MPDVSVLLPIVHDFFFNNFFRAGHRLADDLFQKDNIAFTGAHFSFRQLHAPKLNVDQLCAGEPEFFGGLKELLEVQLLCHVDYINNFIGVVALQAVFDTGDVTGGIERCAIRFLYHVRRILFIFKLDNVGTLFSFNKDAFFFSFFQNFL